MGRSHARFGKEPPRPFRWASRPVLFTNVRSEQGPTDPYKAPRRAARQDVKLACSSRNRSCPSTPNLGLYEPNASVGNRYCGGVSRRGARSKRAASDRYKRPGSGIDRKCVDAEIYAAGSDVRDAIGELPAGIDGE